MIFLDTNIFLRFLIHTPEKKFQELELVASDLFSAIERGEIEATTSEVVLDEVCYVLASRRQYNRTAADIVSFMAPLLRLKGIKFPDGDKRVYLRALRFTHLSPNWNSLIQ